MSFRITKQGSSIFSCFKGWKTGVWPSTYFKNFMCTSNTLQDQRLMAALLLLYTAREEVTVCNTGISLLLSISVWFFLSPPIEYRDLTNGLTSLSMDDVAKKGHPKFNPQPGWGLNPGPSGWHSEILPTVSWPSTHITNICFRDINWIKKSEVSSIRFTYEQLCFENLL